MDELRALNAAFRDRRLEESYAATATRSPTIARACKAARVPALTETTYGIAGSRFSTLRAARGRRWAGSSARKHLSTTADTYTHVLMDAIEVDYSSVSAGSSAIR
jgi:hypothetical protein